MMSETVQTLVDRVSDSRVRESLKGMNHDELGKIQEFLVHHVQLQDDYAKAREELQNVDTLDNYAAEDGIPRGSVPYLDFQTFKHLRDELSKKKHTGMTPNARAIFEEFYVKDMEDGTKETIEERLAAISIDIAQAEIAHMRKRNGIDVRSAPLSKEEIEKVQAFAEQIYDLQVQDVFRFNTPTNMNFGRWKKTADGYELKKQMGSACFVEPIDDEFGQDPNHLGDGILKAWVIQQLIHKGGGGTGFGLNRLRPKGSLIGYNPEVDGVHTIDWSSSRGISSGPISFLEHYFNQATEAVMQGNTRRGANMGIQRIDHPDFLDHMYAKFGLSTFAREVRMKNFNLSLAMTDEFMEAAKNDHHYTLRNPHRAKLLGDAHAKTTVDDLCSQEQFIKILKKNRKNPMQPVTTPSMYLHENRRDVVNAYSGDVIGFIDDGLVKINARKILGTIAELCHTNGEPGMVFIDRMNEYNPDIAHFEIEATNPCAEQPLGPYEACNLGSINLLKFVEYDAEGKAYMNEGRLKDTIKVVARALDNVIDRNDFPAIEIRRAVDNTRKIGPGYMGVADAMMMLGVRYGSEESIPIAERWAKLLSDTMREASHELALEKGEYLLWKDSFYNPESDAGRDFRKNPKSHSRKMQYDLGVMRNAFQTTQAPTGTISRTANCSSGIEPAFGLVYTSNVMNTQLLDMNPGFLEVLKKIGIIDKEYIPDIKMFDVVYDPQDEDMIKEIKPKGSAPSSLKPTLELLSAIYMNGGSLTVPDIKKAISEDARERITHIKTQIERIPEEWREVFVTAGGEGEITPQGHISIQKEFQDYTDSSISKTINMPRTTSVDDILMAYIKGWELGLKGITMYRDKSRDFQILSRIDADGVEETLVNYRRPLVQKGFIVELPIGESIDMNGTGFGQKDLVNYDPARVFVTVGYDPKEKKVNSLFMEVSVMDPQMSAVLNNYCIEISHALKSKDSAHELTRLIKQYENHRTKGAMGVISEDGSLRTQVQNDTIPNAMLKTMYFMRFLSDDFRNFDEGSMNERYDYWRAGNVTLKEIIDPIVKGRISMKQADGNPSLLPKGITLELPPDVPKNYCPSC
ncbi:MAG: adenosylcobalamin-dependent ribonucleoside-diphosphate reductase [Nanoarchaeota archaeon]